MSMPTKQLSSVLYFFLFLSSISILLVIVGAALYGASLSRQFKTKDIRVTDTLTYEVQASYFASTPGSRTINSHIFPRGSKYGTKKTLTFNKRKEDFSLWLDYKNEVAAYARITALRFPVLIPYYLLL